MDSYYKLKAIIENKNNYVEYSLDDNQNNNLKISDFAIDFDSMKKDNFSFNLFTYKKMIPEKNSKSNNKLDYEMKNYYFLKLYINNDDDLLEMTIDKSLSIEDIHLSFLKYKEKIHNTTSDSLLEELCVLLEK